MADVLVLGAAQKAASAKLRIPCDFGDMPLLIQGYNIATKTVTCSGSGAPTVSGVQLDYPYQVSCLLTGGTVGTYDITYTIVMDDPDATTYVGVGNIQIL